MLQQNHAESYMIAKFYSLKSFDEMFSENFIIKSK